MAAFLNGATTTLDVAIYDLRLAAGPGAVMLGAFQAAVKRGVHVRLMFNQDHPANLPVPPPAEIDWAFVDQLKASGVETKPIPGVPDLMHHKYVVRDVGTPLAAVLTGSTNWTNDSWNREENVVFTIASPDVAAVFDQNFTELWQNPVVADSGRINAPWQALADVISRGKVDVSGVYDATQMDQVQHQWGEQSTSEWKIAAFRSIVAAVKFGSKRSTPYAVGSVHDFMHAKILVADDYVYAGSFNLSHSGEQNAENVVQIESHAVAELCAAYIDHVAARYGGRPLAGT